MFPEMRAAVGIPKGRDILDYVHSLPDKEQAEAFAKIQEIESGAMKKQVPQAGLVTLMEYLDRQGIKKAICTRNFEYDRRQCQIYPTMRSRGLQCTSKPSSGTSHPIASRPVLADLDKRLSST